MAADFLATHGIDLQAELSKAQFGHAESPPVTNAPTDPAPFSSSLPLLPPQPLSLIRSVILPTVSHTQTYDIHLSVSTGLIRHITPSSDRTPFQPPATTLTAVATLALPSLCHPHIHLDKPHLFTHSRFSHLTPKSGSFSEALSLTSQAKSLFTLEDLLERGNWLIAESVGAGVTHMRAFVEADAIVGTLCVEAGLKLKQLWQGRCEVQICAFAQDPVFSHLGKADEGVDPTVYHQGNANKAIVEKAVRMRGVEAVGSTPYVESSLECQRQNVEWAVRLAIRMEKHLDLHLDYNLDSDKEVLVWFVLETLKQERWVASNPGKTVCLGHCTRLTLFREDEWMELAAKVADLPIYFVGLPTSDIFMMGRPAEAEGPERVPQNQPRATLPIPWMIRSLELNACLGVNNVGNAFTPWGSADPLSVASLGVGLFQVGTAKDAQMLYECVSTRAREAIGLGMVDSGQPKEGTSDTYNRVALELKEGNRADIVLFGSLAENGGIQSQLYRRRRSVKEIVYDAGRERVVLLGGYQVGVHRTE